MTRLFAAASPPSCSRPPSRLCPDPAPPVEKREAGKLVLENMPETPAEVREGLRRYQNAR